MALTEKLTAIADAIRAKTGGTEPMTLEGMPGAISGIQTGGGDALFGSMVDGTMTEFVATAQMQGVRAFAFHQHPGLSSADLSELGTKNGALHELISYDAFSKCQQLERIVLPKAAESATNATQWMFSRAFAETGISEFVSDYPGTFGWNAVQVFRYSQLLRTVRIPNITFGGSMEYFDGCPVLELVEFGGGTIGNNVFRNCAALHTIIIRADTLAALGNQNAFTGVTGPVSVYVSSDLIGEYRAATNWSSLYTAGVVDFVAIEGSEYT